MIYSWITMSEICVATRDAIVNKLFLDIPFKDKLMHTKYLFNFSVLRQKPQYNKIHTEAPFDIILLFWTKIFINHIS